MIFDAKVPNSFSRVSCCNGKPAYRAKIYSHQADIFQDGLYKWRLVVTKPSKTALPKFVLQQDFWKLAEAKAWFIRFAQETAAADRAQPGAKGARRKPAAPRGGRLGRERTS